MFSGSIVALVTPFDKNNEVDYRKLGELVEWQISEGSEGILVCGTTGESPVLSREEKALILKTTLSVAKGQVPIIMGTGCNDTKSSVLATRFAKAVGADACLIVLPYYNKPTERGVYNHFLEISKVELPIICYHHPGRTGLEFTPEQLVKLAKIPNVVGIKESSGRVSYVKDILSKCETTILSGDDPLTFEMLGLGAKGVISVLANIAPKDWSFFVKAYKQNKIKQALEIHDKYKDLLGVLFNEVNPQGVKYALSLMGKILPNYRLPLLEPTQQNKQLIKEQMLKINLI